MKLCFVSTTIQQPTGYAKVSFNMLKELVKVPGLEVFHYTSGAVGTVPYRAIVEGVTYKENKDFDFEGLQGFCQDNSVDVVMIYNDIGITLSYLQKWCPPRLWVYLDTVAQGIPPQLLNIIEEKAERIYLFNDYWKSVYNFKQARVLEHGVDTDTFKFVETKELRDKLNIPQDALVFLNANRNSRRKRLDLTISAFVQFSKRNPKKNAYLILMTSKSGYYDVGTILYNEIYRWKHDCSKKVLSILTDKQLFTDEAINQFYNLADVGINTSTGEGYGLTALEHLAVCKPQVLTELPSYTFVSKKNAAFVHSNGDREYYDREDHSGAYHDTFTSKDVADAMEDVLDKQVKFTVKTWDNVMSNFIAELFDAPPEKKSETE